MNKADRTWQKVRKTTI